MARWGSALIRRLTAPVSPCVNRDYRICSRCGEESEVRQGVDKEMTICTPPPKGYLPIYIAVLPDAGQCNYGTDVQQSHQQRVCSDPQHERKASTGILQERGKRNEDYYPETREMTVAQHPKRLNVGERNGNGDVTVRRGRDHGGIQLTENNRNRSQGTEVSKDVLQCQRMGCNYNKENRGSASSQKSVRSSDSGNKLMKISASTSTCDGDNGGGCSKECETSTSCCHSSGHGDGEEQTSGNGTSTSRFHYVDDSGGGIESGTGTSGDGDGDSEQTIGNATRTSTFHFIDHGSFGGVESGNGTNPSRFHYVDSGSFGGVESCGTSTTSRSYHGLRWRRYLVKAVHLSHPLMTKLLQRSAHEFGYSQHGALRVLCDPLTLHVLLLHLRLLHIDRTSIPSNYKPQDFTILTCQV